MKAEEEYQKVTDLVIFNDMKRKHKIILATVIGIIIISNLPPVTYFFQEQYHYQNKDGSFQFFEQGGPTQDFEVAKTRFENFKRKNAKYKGDILYRTFTIKPWRFWEWWQMVAHSERFTMPYLQ